MKSVKLAELNDNQKEMLDLAYSGEILLISRPAERNVVVMSEAEFNKSEKSLKNSDRGFKNRVEMRELALIAENTAIQKRAEDIIKAMKQSGLDDETIQNIMKLSENNLIKNLI